MSHEQRDEFDRALDEALAGLNLRIEAVRRERMADHYERLIEANRQFNLTRITSPVDAAVKHYADSLTLLATGWVHGDRKLSVLDVGTGAGFPAVPLAIVCDRWSILAIDGTGKKVRFVEDSAAALGLAHLAARHVRLEELVRQGSERFELVTVRAVGKIPELLADLAAVTRPGGSIAFYKSEQADAEVAAAEAIASKLRLAMTIHHVELAAGQEKLTRRLVRYQRPR